MDNPFRSILIAAGFLLAFLTSCTGPLSYPPTVTPEATLTPKPPSTPVPDPLGSEGNPLVIGYVSEAQDPNIITSADEVARLLTIGSGYAVQSRVFSNYTDLLSGMLDQRVHMAWLHPFTYMLASQNGLAKVVLLANHFGVYEYGTQFLANRSSGFTPFFDIRLNRSTAKSEVALQQFQGKRPCWVEPSSASGYILPLGLLLENEIQTLAGVIDQTHTSVIRSLYIKGICDFGATFAISGDPRTSSTVQGVLIDVMDQVVVIWQSDPIIPNLNLSFHPSLPSDMQQNLVIAWLVLIGSDTNRQLISTAANFEIEDLKIVDDTLYDPLRLYTSYTGISLESLIGK